MSRAEYEFSRSPAVLVAPFYGLIMAAMRRADSANLWRLKQAWPEVWEELQARYDSPGGLLEGERG